VTWVYHPEPIDAAELGRRARHYVEMAAVGLRVPIVEHGVVVAHLVEPETGSRTERLRALGRVREASGRLTDLLPPPEAVPGERSLSDTLREMREEERG